MLLDAILKRGSIENPKVSLTDPKIFDILDGGGDATSGVSVTRNSVLGYPAVWRGTTLLAKDVGKLPLCVFARLGDGKEKDRRHPAFRLLRRKPNPEMTASQFRLHLTAHAILTGNGYAQIIRDRAGRPIRMWPLDPDQTIPMRADGVLFYRTKIDNRDVDMSREDVLHIRGLGFDGLVGYSVVSILKEALGLGLAAQRYGSVFFKNNARPNVVIEVPYKFRDAKAVEDFRRRFGEKHAGPDNAHRPAILEGGGKLTPIAINNEDAEFLKTREFEVRQIANILGLPPHKLGDPTRTSFASLEQENQSYLDSSLDPWLVEWEQECEDKLLSDSEKDGDTHLVEFIRQALLRADLKTRYTAYSVGIQNGFLSRNEARSRENLNPVDGGDELLQPLNMTTVDEGKDEDNPQGDKGSGEMKAAAYRELITSILRRWTTRLTAHAVKAAKHSDTFHDWLEKDLEGLNRPQLEAELSPAVRVIVLCTLGTTGNNTKKIASEYFAEVRKMLNDASGTATADVFPDCVTRTLTAWQPVVCLPSA